MLIVWANGVSLSLTTAARQPTSKIGFKPAKLVFNFRGRQLVACPIKAVELRPGLVISKERPNTARQVQDRHTTDNRREQWG